MRCIAPHSYSTIYLILDTHGAGIIYENKVKASQWKGFAESWTRKQKKQHAPSSCHHYLFVFI